MVILSEDSLLTGSSIVNPQGPNQNGVLIGAVGLARGAEEKEQWTTEGQGGRGGEEEEKA